MAPRLSVVVAGSRKEGPSLAIFEALEPLLASGEVEVILATARQPPGELERGARVVARAPGTTLPELRLAGVRAAQASLVAVTEDFCAPAKGWAEALIEEFDKGAAEVLGGPVSRRAGGASDWALSFAEYGRFFRARPAGPVHDLAPVNVAYAAGRLREALGEDATALFEVDLHARLRASGARFLRVPAAVMFDENRLPLGAAARAQYHHGRHFGGRRVAGGGLARRILRALLAPAVPIVLLARIVPEAVAAGHGARLAVALPALVVLLAAWALGEAAGSLLGPGKSGARWT